MSVKIQPVDNRGPNSAFAILERQLCKASEADLATAFVTLSGVNAVHSFLKQAARNGRVRVLTGLYQGFTEPAALRKLFQMQSETKGRLEVRLSTEAGFHWKAYFFKSRGGVSALVGSSNLTNEGITDGCELNVFLSGTAIQDRIRSLRSRFDEAWLRASAPLTLDEIRRYELERPTPTRFKFKVRMPPDAARQRSAVLDVQRSFWVSFVRGRMSPKTEQIVERATHWDKKGWWCVADSTHRYNTGDRIIQLDFNSSRIEVVDVKDTTETEHATPDGRRFFAYQVVSKIRNRRMTDNRWTILRRAGLIAWKSPTRWGKISEKQYQEWVAALRRE